MQRTQPDVRTAAAGYWDRRGLHTEPDQVVLAASAPLLLLTLLGAVGGGVVLPRPAADWHVAQARLLDRRIHPVPVAVETGGVPDPFALLEVVRRARREGGDPRVLVLSVADDPTGTVPPPELVREVCEVAADEGLVVVSDETWRDTFHAPHDTVVVSPAEILPDSAPCPTVLLVDLEPTLSARGATHAPAARALSSRASAASQVPPVAVARFPAGVHGRRLAERVDGLLSALDGRLPRPAVEAAAEALSEPPDLCERRGELARTHGRFAAALYRVVVEAGGLARPPSVGRQLYVDLESLRPVLTVRGIDRAVALEAELIRRLGPYARGGHRFGDDPHRLRARLSTDLLAPGAPGRSWPVGERQEHPDAADALLSVRTVLTEPADEGSLR